MADESNGRYGGLSADFRNLKERVDALNKQTDELSKIVAEVDVRRRLFERFVAPTLAGGIVVLVLIGIEGFIYRHAESEKRFRRADSGGSESIQLIRDEIRALRAAMRGDDK